MCPDSPSWHAAETREVAIYFGEWAKGALQELSFSLQWKKPAKVSVAEGRFRVRRR